MVKNSFGKEAARAHAKEITITKKINRKGPISLIISRIVRIR